MLYSSVCNVPLTDDFCLNFIWHLFDICCLKMTETCRSYLCVWTSAIRWKLTYLYWVCNISKSGFWKRLMKVLYMLKLPVKWICNGLPPPTYFLTLFASFAFILIRLIRISLSLLFLLHLRLFLVFPLFFSFCQFRCLLLILSFQCPVPCIYSFSSDLKWAEVPVFLLTHYNFSYIFSSKVNICGRHESDTLGLYIKKLEKSFSSIRPSVNMLVRLRLSADKICREKIFVD